MVEKPKKVRLDWHEAVGKVDSANPQERKELAVKRQEFYRLKAATEARKIKMLQPPSLKAALNKPEKYGFLHPNVFVHYAKKFEIPANAKTAHLSTFLKEYFTEVVSSETKLGNEGIDARVNRETYLTLYYLSNLAKDKNGKRMNVDLLLPGETVEIVDGKLNIYKKTQEGITAKYRIDGIDLRPQSKEEPAEAVKPDEQLDLPKAPEKAPAKAPGKLPASATAPASAPAEKLPTLGFELMEANQALRYLSQVEGGEVIGEFGKQSILVMIKDGLIKELEAMNESEKVPGEVMQRVDYLKTEISALRKKMERIKKDLEKQPSDTEKESERTVSIERLNIGIKLCKSAQDSLFILEHHLKDLQTKFLPQRLPGTVEAMKIVTNDRIAELSKIAENMEKLEKEMRY